MERLITWNVESIRSHHDQVVSYVATHRPDVIALQETRCGARRFPRAALTDLGYDLVLHGGDDGRGGVAVGVLGGLDGRADLVPGIPGAVPPLDEPRSISLTWQGIRLHNLYAPNGRKVATAAHRAKLAWFELFRHWLAIDGEGRPGPTIVLGDLNIAPTDLDVWEPRRYRKRNLTSGLEREAFTRLLAGDRTVGAPRLVDVVRRDLGERSGFTWWNRRSDFYATDRGWRLDHVLADPATASRVVSVVIDRAERGRPGSTDHAPIIVDLAAAAAAAAATDTDRRPSLGLE